MKRYWLALESVIAVAAGATVSYLISILFDLPLALVLGLYLTATVTTLWMVFRILKDPYSTDKTFDEFFYQDRDDIRRNGRE
jgi:hypothetical protein